MSINSFGRIQKETKKPERPLEQSLNNVNNFINDNVMYVDTFRTHVTPIEFVPSEISDDLQSTPLTNDLYSLDIDNDSHLLSEFRVLKADTVPSQACKRKPEQTDAQKEAVRLLKLKFRYSTRNPPPNHFQDTRTEREKLNLF